MDKKKRDWSVFISSVFFVLGFSVIFSIVGVLLQSILSNVAYTVQIWLGRIGGVIIILFGLYLLGLIRIKFLEQDHKFAVKRKFKSSYVTSFVFGAAFAVGWTPCVGAVLGAVLTLAATQPSIAFFCECPTTCKMPILMGLSDVLQFFPRQERFIKWNFHFYLNTTSFWSANKRTATAHINPP